jgi:cytochrome oxidase Cu insertion factor (SCO1/SenC/PrrC family)
MWKRVAIAIGVIVVVLAGGFYFLLHHYPRPQIASAAGQVAPDFTLQDSEGSPFTLSAERGHNVVLFFYRGYW